MNTNLGLIGRKLGCTQIFSDDGNVTRVTVIEAGPCVVVRKRTLERDGYTALQLAFGERRGQLVSKPLKGYYEKNGVQPRAAKNKRGVELQFYPKHLKELRLPAELADRYKEGDVLTAVDLFKEGQHVDVTGTSRGRGFTGVMRRWNMSGMVQTHGTHEYRRHGGSIGTNMTPGRTMPGLKMPGQYGNERSTMLNVRVAKIVADQNLVLIEGAVPGSKNGIVTVRGTVRRAKKTPTALPSKKPGK